MMLFNELNGANFSDDKQYRNVLWRTWNEDKPIMAFIGLNPSTANEWKTDPTIRKVCKIANNNGFGGIVMLNLFTIVSADPKILLRHKDPVGEADLYLTSYKKTMSRNDMVVFAWGAFEEAKERAKKVIEMFPNAMCLRINADGSPQHPLYISDFTKPIPYVRKKGL